MPRIREDPFVIEENRSVRGWWPKASASVVERELGDQGVRLT